MNTLETFLLKIGCNKEESSVFLCCSEFGPIGASGISRITTISRTTAYGHINKLHEKGLLKVQDGKHGKVYAAITGDELVSYLATQKSKRNQLINQAEDIKPMLEGLKKNPSAHKVSYYEGDQIFDTISARVMETKQGSYITNIDAILDLKGRSITKLISTFKKNKSNIKEIIYESKFQQQYIEGLSSPRHQIKILPVGLNHSLQSDIGMTDGFYYHIAFDKKTNAIEIDNEIFYKTHKALFEELRKRL